MDFDKLFLMKSSVLQQILSIWKKRFVVKDNEQKTHAGKWSNEYFRVPEHAQCETALATQAAKAVSDERSQMN